MRILLLKDRGKDPFFINMVIQNRGKREIEINSPELVFRRWWKKRAFRILTLNNKEIFPMQIDPGRASVVNIELEQFYHYSPTLRKSGRLSIELKEAGGRKFKSPPVRLKWM